LSVITSIGYDHTDTLGDTIEKIATAKAGIIKPNVPVVVGPQATTIDIFKQVSTKMAAKYIPVDLPGGKTDYRTCCFMSQNNQTVLAILNEIKLQEQ